MVFCCPDEKISFLFGEPQTSSSSQEPGHNHREQTWMASQVHFLPFPSGFAESWLSRSELAQWKHRLMTRCWAFPTAPLLPSPGSSHRRAGWQGPFLEPSGPSQPCPTQLRGLRRAQKAVWSLLLSCLEVLLTNVVGFFQLTPHDSIAECLCPSARHGHGKELTRHLKINKIEK